MRHAHKICLCFLNFSVRSESLDLKGIYSNPKLVLLNFGGFLKINISYGTHGPLSNKSL